MRIAAEEKVEAAETKRVDDLREQDAQLRSNNEATRKRAQEADDLERRLGKVEAKLGKRFDALEAEREKRREAEARVMEEQDAVMQRAHATPRFGPATNTCARSRAPP